MSENKGDCPVCLYHRADVSLRQDGSDGWLINCLRCGSYELSDTLAHIDLEQRFGPRWKLSGAIRNRYEGGSNVTLKADVVQELLDAARIPTNLYTSIELLTRHVHRMARSPHEEVGLNPSADFPLVYAQSYSEFKYYIKKALELGYLETENPELGYRLGLKGWDFIIETNKTSAKSDQAFVAMWFDQALTQCYADGFAPALQECGFHPTRIDLHEHNEKIDDRIIAEIRRSGLLVADFTGHRGGVYFEAGFAMGLGIPVIWTCRSSDIADAHFDTRQYNHVVWDEPEDLKEKLKIRIEATVPKPS